MPTPEQQAVGRAFIAETLRAVVTVAADPARWAEARDHLRKSAEMALWALERGA